MIASPLRILVAEDEAAHAEAIRRALSSGLDAVEVSVTDTLHGYRQAVAASVPHIALIDLNLPDGRALEVLQLHPEAVGFPILVMTSYGNEQIAVEALKSGALDYVVKSPEAFAAMPRTVARALREWELIEEKRRAAQALRENEERYQALMRTAMEGYWVVDKSGRLLEVNDAYCGMIGYCREILLSMSIGDLDCAETPEEVRAHVEKVKVHNWDRFESRHRRAGGEAIDVEVSTIYLKGREEFICFIHDISARKRSEEAREATVELLRLCNGTDNLRELMGNLMHFFQRLTGCEAVGVRLKNGTDFPYYQTRGFSEEFVLAENSLCTADPAGRVLAGQDVHPVLDCMCGNVIRSRTDSAKPFFTARGSFWSSNTSELLATATDADRQARTRNRCNGEGYESVALVPLRLHKETFGLFQFNDRQPGRFSAEKIALLEDLMAYVAIAMAKLRTDQALQDSDERFRLAMEAANDGLWELDLETGRSYFSPACSRMLGYETEEFAGSYRNWLEFVHPEDTARVLAVNEQCIAQRTESAYAEFRMRAKDGGWRWVLGRGKVTNRDADGKALLMVGTHVDITERKKGEERIEHLNQVLRALRSVDQLIVREKDAAKLVRDICQLLVEHRGYRSTLIILTDAAGAPVEYAQSGKNEAFRILADSLAGGKVPSCCGFAGRQTGVFRVTDRAKVCADCPMFPDCASSEAMCVQLAHEEASHGFISVSLNQEQAIDDEEVELFQGLAADLAFALHNIEQTRVMQRLQRDRDRIEAELRQSQKMEAIGQLAGGIAHDFNNMLSVILGFAQFGMTQLDPENAVFGFLQEIDKAGQRSAELTRQLLAFSRKQVTQPQVVNLNGVISDRRKMLFRLIGEDISIDFAPGDGLWDIWIDPTQTDQILTNLAVNARDAIAGVGSIAIATANVTLDESAGGALRLPPGDYVQLSLSDTGSGMDAETAERIFEPFFTTKGEGKGTGLGLSTVYGIVKQNEGAIRVHSEPGVGTTFAIHFPRNRQQAAMLQEKPGAVSLEGTETVLLVEDEQQILALVARVLGRYGYTVLATSSPQDACRICENHAGDIHLLLTDVVMPGMNGKELQARIQEMKGGIRTLFTSGYPDDIVAHRGIIEQGLNFIPKPFAVLPLLKKVRAVLDAAA